MTGELRNLLREARDRRVRELLDYEAAERAERDLNRRLEIVQRVGGSLACRKGHVMSPDNTIFVAATGWVRCRECKRAADRARYWRQKAAA